MQQRHRQHLPLGDRDDQLMGKTVKHLKGKPCNHCHTAAYKLTRITCDALESYIMVCDDCWNIYHTKPGYTYGGVWKARKRR